MPTKFEGWEGGGLRPGGEAQRDDLLGAVLHGRVSFVTWVPKSQSARGKKNTLKFFVLSL